MADKPAKLLQTELLIAYVLRGGVIVCGLVIALGIGISLLHPNSHQGLSSDQLSLLLQGKMLNETAPHTVAQFSDGLKTANAETLMALGLVLLIALPVIRVTLTVILFFVERDYTYTVITLIVLSILMTGIIFGKAL